MREEDFEPLFEISSDRQLWAQHPVPERAERPFFAEWFAEKLAAGGTLVAGRDGAIAACSTYSNLRAENGGTVEIGSTFVARPLWGSTVNATMKRLMLSHAFTAVERVEFLVWRDNLRSRRAVEKIGGRLTDRIVDAHAFGRSIPHLVYEIDRDSFATGPLSR
jgi:RimJ/RimL family protein N-acetyltransferase